MLITGTASKPSYKFHPENAGKQEWVEIHDRKLVDTGDAEIPDNCRRVVSFGPVAGKINELLKAGKPVVAARGRFNNDEILDQSGEVIGCAGSIRLIIDEIEVPAAPKAGKKAKGKKASSAVDESPI